MIISRTPLRISFAGGGSDLPSYYRDGPGAVVTTSINKYIYITLNKSFDDLITVRYKKEEKVKKIDDLKHNLIREALRMVKIYKGIDISSTAEIPSEGSGLGSSSSYVVGVLNALFAYKEKHVSAEKLAKEACRIEIDKLHKPIGKQDQYIAAYGGFQFIQFNPNHSVYVDPIICLSETKSRLENNLLLLYTGITRSADVILFKQKKNLDKIQKKMITKKLVDLALEMSKMLRNNKLDSFGEILDENWNLKKQMAEGITTPAIDQWYETGKKNGAIGGKILGAGGGGFILFYAPASKHLKIIKALPKLRPMKIKFEPQGSKIIFIS